MLIIRASIRIRNLLQFSNTRRDEQKVTEYIGNILRGGMRWKLRQLQTL